MSDKLFVTANNFVGNYNKIFSVVRYGNVMGSRGSVIPYFLKIKKNDHYPITHKDMTRFNISLDEGVNFCSALLKKYVGWRNFCSKNSFI